MTRITGSTSGWPLQYQIYFGIAAVVALLTGIAYFRDNLVFQKYLGRINPLVAVAIVALLGLVLLAIVQTRGWFAIYRASSVEGLLVAAVASLIFGLIIILVDFNATMPEDTNVLFPDSLLFYPAIAFVVEIIFHVLPLSLLLFGLTSIFKNTGYEAFVLPCIIVVALLEPVFQTAVGPSQDYPLWATGYIAFHIFLINLCQLLLFRRYDFVTMYSFRLMYYALWHIAWGHLRLGLLF